MSRRIFAIVIFMCTFVLSAHETNDVAVAKATEVKVFDVVKNGKQKHITETFVNTVLIGRKEEVSLLNNGHVDYVFDKLFRNGETIYSSTVYQNKNVTVRSFYSHGKMILEEGDLDGDGFFEVRILFDESEVPIEAFSMEKSGKVRAFEQLKFQDLQKAFKKLQE